MFETPGILDRLNKLGENCMLETLGIQFTEVGENYICATMPVDQRTTQPFGILHGGASVTLAETLGSVASTILIDTKRQLAVGLEINANHLKSASAGETVTGKVLPLHIGRKTHVWEIKITNASNKLICVSRLTVSIIDRENK